MIDCTPQRHLELEGEADFEQNLAEHLGTINEDGGSVEAKRQLVSISLASPIHFPEKIKIGETSLQLMLVCAVVDEECRLALYNRHLSRDFEQMKASKLSLISWDGTSLRTLEKEDENIHSVIKQNVEYLVYAECVEEREMYPYELGIASADLWNSKPDAEDPYVIAWDNLKQMWKNDKLLQNGISFNGYSCEQSTVFDVASLMRCKDRGYLNDALILKCLHNIVAHHNNCMAPIVVLQSELEKDELM